MCVRTLLKSAAVGWGISVVSVFGITGPPVKHWANEAVRVSGSSSITGSPTMILACVGIQLFLGGAVRWVGASMRVCGSITVSDSGEKVMRNAPLE